ncbi:MAG: hypothetical protein JO296_11270 [Pseudonocardiales bacterium]|nr:hypothetical protein [Pseudonocardiales bacterium]
MGHRGKLPRRHSALPSDAAASRDLGFVAGVTTNLKLMAAAAGPPIATLAELCDCGPCKAHPRR